MVIDHSYARVDHVGVLEVHVRCILPTCFRTLSLALRASLVRQAASIFPGKEVDVFSVLAHPHGAQVYRGISACVKRKVLERDDAGDMLLEVHNVSEWNVLGLVRGAVVSKLFVELSLERSLLHFGLVPGSSQMLQDLYGVWRCYSLCGEELKEFLELKDDDDEDEDGGCRLRLVQGSLVTLYQRFEFAKGIPVMLHGAVARAALGQIRASFEDLIVAVWRMQRGDSVLPPLADVILDEIGERLDEGGDEDEASVAAKSVLDEKANAFVRKNAAVNDEVSNRLRDELEASSYSASSERPLDAQSPQSPQSPRSYPLTRLESLEMMTRVGSLRSLRSVSSFQNLELDAQRIRSVRSLTSLVELEASALAMQRDRRGGEDTPVERRGFFKRWVLIMADALCALRFALPSSHVQTQCSRSLRASLVRQGEIARR